MAFAGINYLAVLVAAVAAWLVGAVWYMVLSKQWMTALEKTSSNVRRRRPEPWERLASAVFWRFARHSRQWLTPSIFVEHSTQKTRRQATQR